MKILSYFHNVVCINVITSFSFSDVEVRFKKKLWSVWLVKHSDCGNSAFGFVLWRGILADWFPNLTVQVLDR